MQITDWSFCLKKSIHVILYVAGKHNQPLAPLPIFDH